MIRIYTDIPQTPFLYSLIITQVSVRLGRCREKSCNMDFSSYFPQLKNIFIIFFLHGEHYISQVFATNFILIHHRSISCPDERRVESSYTSRGVKETPSHLSCKMWQRHVKVYFCELLELGNGSANLHGKYTLLN